MIFLSFPHQITCEKIQIRKFRVGDHNLNIETGWHGGPKTPTKKRTCCKCGTVVDEIHFFVDCLYDEPRIRNTVMVIRILSQYLLKYLIIKEKHI